MMNEIANTANVASSPVAGEESGKKTRAMVVAR